MRNPFAQSERKVRNIERTAKHIRDYAVKKRILTVALAALLTLLGMFYIVAVLYKQSGSFTVSLDKFEMTKYGLSLSESSDMLYPSSYLNAVIDEEITNISEDKIPANVNMIDGEHNGDDYIAYTFYLQNAGEAMVSYEYTVYINNVTQNLDSAIRTRLYVDGEYTTYAKTRTDGTGAEKGTKEFYSADVIEKRRVEEFAPGDVTKFTVVIWIEGNDPDCTDWLIGGQVHIEMGISIVH